MASAYEHYYENQPPAVKTIAVAGLALLGWILYRSFKKSQDEKKANQAAGYAKTDLDKLAATGVHPTLSDAEFESLSQSIVQACNGCGTDENAIYQVFGSLTNQADILKLIIIFGVRYYEPCAASQPISYAIWLADGNHFGGSLPTFLSYDLSTGELTKVNSILAAKGIEYKF